MISEKDFLCAVGCATLEQAYELIEILKKKLYLQMLDTSLLQYGLNHTDIGLKPFHKEYEKISKEDCLACLKYSDCSYALTIEDPGEYVLCKDFTEGEK